MSQLLSDADANELLENPGPGGNWIGGVFGRKLFAWKDSPKIMERSVSSIPRMSRMTRRAMRSHKDSLFSVS